jgi:hypothetical protein
MIYKEVPSSSILPLSTYSANLDIGSIEKFFNDFFYFNGPENYNDYKTAVFLANTSFLKDVMTSIIRTVKEKDLPDDKKVALNLISSSLMSQISLLEELFKSVDYKLFNALICAAFVKHIKKYFS